MYAFDYHRPDSLRKAVNIATKVEDAKFLAGGHTLLPTMKQRLASPSALIDLNKVTELAGIELRGRTVVIGAMTRHAAVEQSPELQQALPALAELAHVIGDPQVRHRGTIGGSIANNDPAADYPAACLALGATIVTTKRKLTADEFFTGLFETALEDGELITKVIFPVVNRAAYEKFRNPASRYALAGVFVAKRGSDIRVAVTGAGENGVFRLPEFEAALKARFSPKSIEGLKVSPDGLIGDIHADPAYRAQLVAVMARRAVARAAARAS
ncbi:Carbon monoxide dehydrogenase medium chain [Hyphomicrobiales bacterium]|nr:Carbon monoxide dehydrogenase medium chain [Hyphomicrobiales bacterium]CAH1667282.1 Carbon monoxide dehydrogenase medium chain [Hyphomicrobiales bacterium]